MRRGNARYGALRERAGWHVLIPSPHRHWPQQQQQTPTGHGQPGSRSHFTYLGSGGDEHRVRQGLTLVHFLAHRKHF